MKVAHNAVADLQPVAEVRDALLASVQPLGPETVPLAEAGGRWSARALVADRDLPSFDSSGMDGWAVRAADVATVPASLRIIGRQPAGESASLRIGPGECVRIFTGAPLPAGSDAVVMQEDTEVPPGEPDRVMIHEVARPWENVRFRGEDIRRGATLIRPGRRLGAPQLAVLAAQGHDRVDVFRRPRVAILPTGSELRVPGRAEPLADGLVFESNGLMVAHLVSTAGGLPEVHAPVPDDPEALRSAMELALAHADLVVTVGGASVGELDLVREMLVALGGTVDLWRIAMKPGKPFFHGRAKGVTVCGLPGNPVSAFVTAVLLIQPLVRRLLGEDPARTPWHPARLGEALVNPGNRCHFVRVRLTTDGFVVPTGVQASHHLGSLATAEGLVEVPARGHLAAGQEVRVLRWD